MGHGISQFYGFQVAGRINSAADFLRNNGDGTSTVIAATPNYRLGTVVSNASAKSLLTSVGDLLYKDLNGDGYIAPGAEPSIPRIDNQHSNYNSRVSDRYVEDASYLRIKNITLSYNVPKKFIKRYYLQSLRLSANVQNVYTFTGYTGYDPEVGSQNGQYSMSGQGMLMYGVDTLLVGQPLQRGDTGLVYHQRLCALLYRE